LRFILPKPLKSLNNGLESPILIDLIIGIGKDSQPDKYQKDKYPNKIFLHIIDAPHAHGIIPIDEGQMAVPAILLVNLP
jgi:hypothetical protein